MPAPFLTAEWRKLIMANYVVPAALLAPYLPYATELDTWEGNCYVSLVGFMFLKTKVLGVPIPLHRNFEEVNLRFYVRHFDGTAWKRGVVFLSEIVPKPAIAWVANSIYGENYATCRMGHRWQVEADRLLVGYDWKSYRGGPWNHLAVQAKLAPCRLEAGSAAEFITEHYWGYAQRGARCTFEYAVEHPRWEVYEVLEHEIISDLARFYGPQFVKPLSVAPASIFMAEGSAISVGRKRVIGLKNL
jgi:uncharacterized protein YqjF (DUF2071 family)